MAYYYDYEDNRDELFEDDFDDWTENEGESEDGADSEAEFFGPEYKKFVHEFIQNYTHLHIEKNNIDTISQALSALKIPPFETSSLRSAFYRDSVKKMHPAEIRNKYLTELFLMQFKGLDAKRNLTTFLDVLRQKETKEIAALANQYHNFPFIMRFVLSVLDAAEATMENTATMDNTIFAKNNNDSCYEYSDILYWENVHDGEINPDADESIDYYDHYDFGSDDEVENESYSYDNMGDICKSLKFYVEELRKESAAEIPFHIRKTFLNRFQNELPEAQRILENVEEEEFFTKIYLGKDGGEHRDGSFVS